MSDRQRGKVDAVRIFIQMRYLSTIFLYSTDTIIQALGLDKMQGGTLLGHMFVNMEKLRYHKIGRCILHVNNAVLKAIATLRKYKMQLIRRSKSRLQPDDDVDNRPLSEPNWLNNVQ